MSDLMPGARLNPLAATICAGRQTGVTVSLLENPGGVRVLSARSSNHLLGKLRETKWPAEHVVEFPIVSLSAIQKVAMVRVHDSADVAADVELGEGTSVWHLAQIREGAVLGKNCVIGRGAYVGSGVRLGANCKVQNYALVYEPAALADGVFVGPAVVFTNDRFPRAITPEGDLKTADDWQSVGVTVGTGASIGARSVCVAPVTVGAWALVAAGSVVINDVIGYALVAGAPAKRIGWVGEAGMPLRRDGDGWVCPASGRRYQESDEVLTPQTEVNQTTTTESDTSDA